MGYFFKVDFSFQTSGFDTAIVKCDSEDKLEFYYKMIKTDVIDVVSITDDIDIVVDDEGLLKSGSPVYEITRNDNLIPPMQLAGVLLFGKNKVSEDGIEITGFDTKKDVVEFVNSISIKVVGKTK